MEKAGRETKICQLPINKPNVGLGCRLAPDGNQEHETKHRINQYKIIQGKIATANLTAEETYQ